MTEFTTLIRERERIKTSISSNGKEGHLGIVNELTDPDLSFFFLL